MAPMPAKKHDDDPVQISATMWDNPYVKGLIWAIVGATTVATSAVGGYALAVDKEYAKKTDLADVKAEMVAQVGRQEVANLRLEKKVEFQADQNRKLNLQDQLFKFDMTPEKQKTQTERALAAKYRQEIVEMTERWKSTATPLK